MTREPVILVVLGNRPQFIKHAAVHRAWLRAQVDDVRMVVVDTGQHYDYSLAGVFLDELEIPQPDVSLGVGSAGHAEQLARMLVPLEELIKEHRPASIVVYGDTNSTLGGALAAAKLNVPVAHIEAGLRSYDRTMPEEVNRVLVDHISDVLLCPTSHARVNLENEGITAGVHVVGDVMADIALALADTADARWPEWQARGLTQGSYCVATIHRAANTEPDALRNVVDALGAIEMPVVLPLHPRTQHALERWGLHVELADLENVMVLPPLGYLDLACVVRHAHCVVTDSGGLQKEAYVHGVPCVTMRETSEWGETVDAGMNTLVGTNPEAVAAAVARAQRPDGELPALYGTGDAADRIVSELLSHARASASLLGGLQSTPS